MEDFIHNNEYTDEELDKMSNNDLKGIKKGWTIDKTFEIPKAIDYNPQFINNDIYDGKITNFTIYRPPTNTGKTPKTYISIECIVLVINGIYRFTQNIPFDLERCGSMFAKTLFGIGIPIDKLTEFDPMMLIDREVKVQLTRLSDNRPSIQSMTKK